MFKFFKKHDSKNSAKNDDQLLSKTASLFIHAAKIDENYTDKEKEIIRKTLIQLGVEESKADKIMLAAEINEEKSNQILDFTREIKNADSKFKIKIIETLWSIIYSNNEVFIPSDAVNNSFTEKLVGLIKRITSETPANKIPSSQECKFCNITSSDCAERIEQDEPPIASSTDDF